MKGWTTVMVKKDARSFRTLVAMGAAATAVGGLLMFAAPSASAAAIDAPNRVAATTHVSAASSSADLPPAYVGSVYTGQVGSVTTYTPQFSGPTPTPSNPNPPTQYVHITAGSSGAVVAKSLAYGAAPWTSPWVLGPGQSEVIPVQALEMVGMANVATGVPGSFTVTAITASQ